MTPQARPKAYKAIREFDLIRALQRRHGDGASSVVCGIGDDTAVITPSKNHWQLLTTDLLAEGIHFDLRTAMFSDIGFRAATANLSDIAAMGGTPRYLLVAIAIPQSGSSRQVHQLYRGLMDACHPHNVHLVGGDTSASVAHWFISITLIGSVPRGRALFRSGAHIGDDLYVTGTLGDSLAGLALLEKARRKTVKVSLSPRHRRFLVRRHLRPAARVLEGRWLSAQRWVTSAIDISDGLSGDLRHICKQSHVGADVNLSALPVSEACRAYARSTAQDPITLALAGGEDYELLFTVSARHRKRFELTAARHGLQMTRIGTIRPAGSGLHGISKDGMRLPLPMASYEHFRPSG